MSAGNELLGRAAELVVSRQLGSTSMLQRALNIGYGLADDLMGQLEEHGVVGPQQTGRSRDVLARADQVAEILNQIGAS